ncbi:cupin domain-containing protein [Phaeobacter sp. C3_T13_0]|uniref:cupin domain-containing protein n=1 Tax=Phaeobacter cretensis TaxID=3342641 RepID=UPI0039BCC904
MNTWIEYTSGDGGIISGWWDATPDTYHATYAALEFVHMIEGRIVITPEGSSPVEVGSGDAFVIEADFNGVREIKEKVLKHFAIKPK